MGGVTACHAVHVRLSSTLSYVVSVMVNHTFRVRLDELLH